MMGVPPIYLFLAQQPGFADADLSSLERAVVGGAPMPEALLETWAARGTAIVQGYGLTEAAPNVLCVPPGGRGTQARLRRQAVSVRRRSPVGRRRAAGTRPECVSAATGATRRRRGGIHRRRLASYRRRRRVRRRGLLPDQGPPQGHVHLRRRERLSGRGRGSAARASEGCRRRGRRRDDEQWGEIGVAFVVADGVTDEELVEWCSARLAKFKVPKSVRFVAEIPRNGLGKIQKQELVSEVAR